MNASDCFPATFFSSRRRFIELAKVVGAELSSLHIATSTAGLPEPLTVEVALLGDRTAPIKVLHIAGTHGVEGAAGAAIQCAILNKRYPIPSNVAVVLVHCLNPWGMSMQRRVNEFNVDLNRNSVFAPEQRSGAPEGYSNVKSLLLPGRRMRFTEFVGRAVWKIARYGFSAVKQAITGGQFVDPNGLFFGGNELQPELVLLKQWLSTSLSDTKRVISIDVHTGLGSFGEDALLLDVTDESDEFKRVAACFGRQRVQGCDPRTSISYVTTGTLANLIQACFPGATVDRVVQEFGTSPPLKVLYALREENYRFFSSDRNFSGSYDAGLVKVFMPDSVPWRERVVERGVIVYQQALKADTEGPGH